MPIKGTFLAICAAALLNSSMATADTLHTVCTGTGCGSNGSVVTTSHNPPTFDISLQGKNKSGDLWVILLSPNNFGKGGSVTLNGVNTTASSVAGSLFSGTAWTSGKLDAYLNTFSSFSPPSPLSAYLPSTQAADPSASGYYVYLFDFGLENFSGTPAFSVGSGSVNAGSLFLSVLTTAGTKNVIVATPQSEALLETGSAPPPPPPTVPEPSSLALFGTGLLSMGGAALRKVVRK